MTNKSFLSNEFTLPPYATRPETTFANTPTNLNVFKKEVDEALYAKDQYERIQNQYADFNTNGHNGTQCNTYNNLKKTRKPRKVFSQFAQRELEEDFQRSPYLTAWKRQQLAQKLNLTERQVRVWFQNRRMRIKNDEKNKKKTPSTKKSQNSKSQLNDNKLSPPVQSANGYMENIPAPMEEFKNLPAPMYTMLHHPNFPKVNQFPSYPNPTDFVNNHQLEPAETCPTTLINGYREIEPVWTYPKYSSYEAFINDQQDMLGEYNFNGNGVGIPTTVRNGNELSHFTSLQNLVYQYE